MSFFDLTGIARKMTKILRRKKIEKKENITEEMPSDVPEDVLKEMKKDPNLLDLYNNLDEENKKIIITAVKTGKIFDKNGLKRTIQKIVKSENEEDIIIALNYYSIKKYGKEFLELPESKQEELMYKILKGIPVNKAFKLYNKFKNENEE